MMADKDGGKLAVMCTVCLRYITLLLCQYHTCYNNTKGARLFGHGYNSLLFIMMKTYGGERFMNE